MPFKKQGVNNAAFPIVPKEMNMKAKKYDAS